MRCSLPRSLALLCLSLGACQTAATTRYLDASSPLQALADVDHGLRTEPLPAMERARLRHLRVQLAEHWGQEELARGDALWSRSQRGASVCPFDEAKRAAYITWRAVWHAARAGATAAPVAAQGAHKRLQRIAAAARRELQLDAQRELQLDAQSVAAARCAREATAALTSVAPSVELPWPSDRALTHRAALAPASLLSVWAPQPRPPSRDPWVSAWAVGPRRGIAVGPSVRFHRHPGSESLSAGVRARGGWVRHNRHHPGGPQWGAEGELWLGWTSPKLQAGGEELTLEARLSLPMRLMTFNVPWPGFVGIHAGGELFWGGTYSHLAAAPVMGARLALEPYRRLGLEMEYMALPLIRGGPPDMTHSEHRLQVSGGYGPWGLMVRGSWGNQHLRSHTLRMEALEVMLTWRLGG